MPTNIKYYSSESVASVLPFLGYVKVDSPDQDYCYYRRSDQTVDDTKDVEFDMTKYVIIPTDHDVSRVFVADICNQMHVSVATFEKTYNFVESLIQSRTKKNS